MGLGNTRRSTGKGRVEGGGLPGLKIETGAPGLLPRPTLKRGANNRCAYGAREEKSPLLG